MCCLHYRGRIGGNKGSLTKIRKVLWPRPSYSLMTIANRWYGSYPWWWSWWWSSRFKDPWFVNFAGSNLRQTADIALLSPAFLPTFLAAFQIDVTLAFHVCVCVSGQTHQLYVCGEISNAIIVNQLYLLPGPKKVWYFRNQIVAVVWLIFCYASHCQCCTREKIQQE